MLFVLFGLVVASFFPFLSLFLDAKGLNASRIGVVIAAMALARIVCSPVWGHLSDTTIGRRRALQVGAAGTAAAGLLLFAVQGYVPVVVAGAALAGMGASVAPNVDAIALAHLGDGRMTEYGRIRAWESLSYAATCLGLGAVLEQVGVRWSMPAYALGCVLVLVWTTAAVAPDRPEPSAGHGRLGAVGAVFREAPRFWLFLLATLFVWTGFNGAWNFIGLKIAEGGGGPLLLGLGTGLGGLVEVPFMRLSSRFAARVGLRPVYVVGCLVYASGFVLWGLVADPTIVALLTVFEGAGFALLFTTAVVVIGRMLPATLYSTGQSLAVTVGFGVGPILGAGIGGMVFDRFGTVALYLGSSALVLVGAAVVWAALSAPSLAHPVPEVEAVL